MILEIIFSVTSNITLQIKTMTFFFLDITSIAPHPWILGIKFVSTFKAAIILYLCYLQTCILS